MEIDQSEVIAACCGVVNPKVTEATYEQAFDLADKLSAKLRKWILKPVQAAFVLPKQYDAQKLFEKLGTTIVFDSLLTDPFEGQALDVKLQAIRSALVAKYPVTSTADFLDDSTIPPSDDEVQDWLALVAIAEDEQRIVTETMMCSLMPEQVDFYVENYPGLYQTLVNVANDTIVEVNANGDELTDDVESTLQVLLRTGQADKPKVAEDDKPETPKRKVSLNSAGQQSPRERIGK